MTTTVSGTRLSGCASRSSIHYHKLEAATGLEVLLHSNGTVFCIKQEKGLINQAVGIPPEGAPFDLWLRSEGEGVPLIGAGTALYFDVLDSHRAVWCGNWNQWGWAIQLVLDQKQAAWAWHIELTNHDEHERSADVVIAQDVGLGNEGGVRGNEAYTSHYIDHRMLMHPDFGPVLFARQNLGQDGKHPALALASPTGACAYATDGIDVYGLRQRHEGSPEVLKEGYKLPSRIRQGESACQALQSVERHVSKGDSTRITFSLCYVPDHPDTISERDLTWVYEPPEPASVQATTPVTHSIFDQCMLLHGDDFSNTEWARLYASRSQEEKENGALWSFCTPEGNHVVSAAKERAVERSHGHILLATDHMMHDEDALGATVYAAGIFAAQVYRDNPNTGRLLTVIRDSLQRTRGSGQRVWVDDGTGWRMLGTPSAFEMGIAHARWLYRADTCLIEIVTRADTKEKNIQLHGRSLEGGPLKWRVTHQLAFGTNELDEAGSIEIDHARQTMRFDFDRESEVLRRDPAFGFQLAAKNDGAQIRLGGDELVWRDGQSRGIPMAVVESEPAFELTITLSAASPAEKDREAPSVQPTVPLVLCSASGAVEGLPEILPWFRHNAWVHLAAPHGLEQYGGAAWGVRDVCQGPLEWLLSEQRYSDIRSILLQVFTQQYQESGLWPQWFMLGRYADIQQVHCHGDVMFWPVKALGDYAAAANDPAILEEQVPYSLQSTFAKTRELYTLEDHADRVVRKYAELCVPGTALVAYGDGDWDDTLQPARPEMREGMVSAWTVQLAYQVFNQLARLYKIAGRDKKAESLANLTADIRADFMKHLMPDGVVSGFATFRDGKPEPLLHPRDTVSGIRYRLLPMTRGIISGMFDACQAADHMSIIREHLRFPDGVRLMDKPVAYRGGQSTLFQRAETAAYFGREVSLQYVHAHLRYAEAAARMGDGAEALWALQVVNPMGLRKRLLNAAPRQSNVYFSSSDAAVLNRNEAAAHYDEIRAGRFEFKSGWRLYSSGPGLFIHKVRCCLLGVRENYAEIEFDPVLPPGSAGYDARFEHEGQSVRLACRDASVPALTINGRQLPFNLARGNPYRSSGGLIVNRSAYAQTLNGGHNDVTVALAKR